MAYRKAYLRQRLRSRGGGDMTTPIVALKSIELAKRAAEKRLESIRRALSESRGGEYWSAGNVTSPQRKKAAKKK